MSLFTIEKSTTGNFWHKYGNGSNEVSISDFQVVIDAVKRTFIIQPKNGSNIPSQSVSFNDLRVIDLSVSTTPIAFTTGDSLIEVLKGLNYTPYIVSSGSTTPIKVWTKGQVTSINRHQTWIDDNFDNTGLGILEMVGWAKRNGQNGTKDQSDLSLINQGVKFPNVGVPIGYANTVLVAHEHDSVEFNDGKKAVNTTGKGTTSNGRSLSGDLANDKIDKTSKVGQNQSGSFSSTETGEDKNYQPSLVELHIERTDDLWINGVGGSSATPNLPQVLTQGGRIVKYIDTSDTTQCPSGVYTFVATDAVDYLYFYGNTPIEAIIPDDFYDLAKGVELQGDVQAGSNVTIKYNGYANSIVISTAMSDIRFNANQVESNRWSFGLSTDSLADKLSFEVTQSGTSAPVIVAGTLKGNFGATITPSYNADGVYEFNASLPIFANVKDSFKQTSNIPTYLLSGDAFGSSLGYYTFVVQTDTKAVLTVYNDIFSPGTALNDLIMTPVLLELPYK